MANIKQPIQKGVAKVPVVMQLEALECGAASLSMILAYYGRFVPLESVRNDCGVSRDGSNARNILKAARYYGLEAKGYRYEIDEIVSKGSFPCIIHWNFNHFIVLTGFKGGKAYLNDPAKGAYSVPMEIFDNSFTGICLQFKPTENFVPGGKPNNMYAYAKDRLKGSGTALIFTAATGFIAALIAAINPAFSRVFLDRILTGKNAKSLMIFILLLLIFNALQIIMSAIADVYNIRINGKTAVIGNTTFIWKILKMPIGFFSQRMSGDICERQLSNANIANTLINTVAPLLLDSLMMAVYLIVMIRYSIVLTAIGLSSIILSSLLTKYISKKRINITRVSMKDKAKLSSYTVAGIGMIETIKSSGAENGYFAKWSGYGAAANAGKVRLAKLDTYLGLLPNFLSLVASSAVLVVGALLIIKGNFTVGMILAFSTFFTQFLAPANKLINANKVVQEMRTQMERIDDVMKYPSDDIFNDNIEVEEYTKLTGNIELKNVTFGYSPLNEPLIKDFNLTLTPGKSVAIIGGSGCGKSTISKLVSGLYKQWSGDILFDGKPINEIDRDVFRSSLSVVDQDIILFEDTIANNIKMWDESIEDFEMILAARDAQIHDDIMERTLGYSHKLIDGGRDFSGGQRQRMEIARVLVQDPTIVILDEATSALDSKTEYNVVKSIKARGITTIVVAHRLSTIRSCDEIIVMNKGEIINRGTHEELIKNCEFYKELITSE